MMTRQITYIKTLIYVYLHLSSQTNKANPLITFSKRFSLQKKS